MLDFLLLQLLVRDQDLNLHEVEMILNCNLNIHAVPNNKDRERYDT